jgi:hypothetical protein
MSWQRHQATLEQSPQYSGAEPRYCSMWPGLRRSCLVQDAAVASCGRSIKGEYDTLREVAEMRPGQRTITTADVWEWVSEQTGSHFPDHLINQVLVVAAADDDDDITLARFTHVVVHMFEAFFSTLDRHATGIITQV